MTANYVIGDALAELRKLPDGYAHCCVTSPPYYAARDYGHPDQIGLEPSLAEYIERLAAVFSEVRRVLRDDGTLWLVMGDGYAVSGRGGASGRSNMRGGRSHQDAAKDARDALGSRSRATGLPPKSLLGVPWRLAFALQDDGWILRQEIIWHKPTAMPESVKDRPTRAHDTLFLFARAGAYYYDAKAIAEPVTGNAHPRGNGENPKARTGDPSFVRQNASFARAVSGLVEQRNARSVWTIPAEPIPDEHYAAYPSALAAKCILAGCPLGGLVLDPFIGTGTTGMVAEQLGRRWFGIELVPANAAIIKKRTRQAGFRYAEAAT